ncbi:MAG: SIR2 family protein [Candidatus Electrothrix sp. GW3-4]|uniref:SIR2 family NAD-dependent protein deacylase n=1 Tax=Candidatus Electrothrix sp. GW3-4 TaxID=3126740 RepID=UPI0030D3DCC2
MPRIQIGAKQAARPNDWRQAVLDQLRSGKVLPIISNRFHDDLLLGGHDQLVRDYAEHYRIPHESGGDLPAAAQYKTVMREVAGAGDFIRREYLEFVKSRLMDLAEAEAKKSNDNNLAGLLEDEESQFDEHDFSTLAANLGYPRFDVPEKDPLLILAGFDLPVYLTTSFHGMLEQALRRAGKQPRSMVCCWHPRITTDDGTDNDPLAADYRPSVQEPLVCHLHGLDSCPESLVLSEDDHLSFLVNVSRDRHLIPNRLRQALNDSSLLLLGYDLAAWDFRTLLYSLIKNRSYRLQSVCVLQLQPSQEEQAYLNRYMDEVDFKVFWGDTTEYLQQLYAGLRG